MDSISSQPHRPDQPRQHQPQRRHKAFADHLQHRLLGAVGDAQVAAQDAAQPVDVLLRQRIVQAEMLKRRLDRLNRRVRHSVDARRIARQQFDKAEHHSETTSNTGIISSSRRRM